jgi:hypothetical protein
VPVPVAVAVRVGISEVMAVDLVPQVVLEMSRPKVEVLGWAKLLS